MFISDMLRKASVECAGRGRAHQWHTICALPQVQVSIQFVNEADYLNVCENGQKQI